MPTLARVLPIILLFPTACATAAATAAADLLYQCEGGEAFTVRDSGSAAVVRFADGDYVLQRKRSSLGRRYASPDAALIIDGETAVFVAEDRLDLDDCRAAVAGST